VDLGGVGVAFSWMCLITAAEQKSEQNPYDNLSRIFIRLLNLVQHGFEVLIFRESGHPRRITPPEIY